MNAQEWLQQVREVDEEVRILRQSMFDAWTNAVRMTPSLDGVAAQSSPDPHKFDVIAELDETIYDRVRELSAMKARAVRVIAGLPDPQQRKVMTAYYIDSRAADGRRKTWEMVCVELYLSYRQVMYARDAALKAIDARM